MSENPTAGTAGNEIEKRQRFDPADLRAVDTFDDAIRLLTDSGMELHDATTAIGDGFVMCEDKDVLIKVPMVILAWSFIKGDFGEDFCIMRVVTVDGHKYVVTDGSSGVCAQIWEFEQRTKAQGALRVERGLRKSEFWLGSDGRPSTEDTGNGRGKTYYLNV